MTKDHLLFRGRWGCVNWFKSGNGGDLDYNPTYEEQLPVEESISIAESSWLNILSWLRHVSNLHSLSPAWLAWIAYAAVPLSVLYTRDTQFMPGTKWGVKHEFGQLQYLSDFEGMELSNLQMSLRRSVEKLEFNWVFHRTGKPNSLFPFFLKLRQFYTFSCTSYWHSLPLVLLPAFDPSDACLIFLGSE